MHETALEARTVGSTVKIMVMRKVMKKYLYEGETSQSLAIARALEDASSDVSLTKKDWDDINAEIEKKNRAKRFAKRKGASIV